MFFRSPTLTLQSNVVVYLVGLYVFGFQRKDPGPEPKRTMIPWSKMGMNQVLRDVSSKVVNKKIKKHKPLSK